MPKSILQNFADLMKARVLEITAEFEKNYDFGAVEIAINKALASLGAALQQSLVSALLVNVAFLLQLKIYAGKAGYRFKEYRTITVTLSNGQRIKIKSPYFVKAKPRSRRKKRGPNGTGAHCGLAVLGFVGHVSPGLLSDALQTALLCPSYEVARTVLTGRGITLDVKTLRRLCQVAGNQDNKLRGSLALSGEEDLDGHTLVVSVDGGRLRLRKRKRGRKADDLKRQGYRTDWKEPKLFTLYLIDAKGDIIKEFRPLHDASMGDHEAIYALLESYLESLELEQLNRIVFCGDGGAWIWSGVEKLCERLDIDENKVFQVLDYTHAKQNLGEIVGLVAKPQQAATTKKWKDWLWNGQLDAIEASIKKLVTDKDMRTQALKKFTNYFVGNSKRMQYAAFREQGLPTGSGHVESAVRRVINLRLKAPGTFWLKEMAECFLFLRSQVISGRWEIFMKNLTSQARPVLQACYITELSPLENAKTA